MIDYDMHVHSTYSDGTLSVKEILEICKKKSLKGVAITDHDTVAAFEDSHYLDEKSLDIIPGVELSTSYNGEEVHILGYNIDYKNECLLKTLDKIKNFRVHRVEEIINKLKHLGYDIEIEEVFLKATKDSSIGRPHIARCLVEKGYFKDTNSAFEEILGNNKPAFVERYKLSSEEGINLIKSAGGIPVLAHPCIIQSFSLSKVIADMIKYGVEGIEVFHTLHSKLDEGDLLNYVIKNNLLITGGSDCHEKLDSNGEFVIGSKGISLEHIQKLKGR